MGEKITNENQTKMNTKVTNDSGQYLKTEDGKQKILSIRRNKERDFSQCIQKKNYRNRRNGKKTKAVEQTNTPTYKSRNILELRQQKDLKHIERTQHIHRKTDPKRQH